MAVQKKEGAAGYKPLDRDRLSEARPQDLWNLWNAISRKIEPIDSEIQALEDAKADMEDDREFVAKTLAKHLNLSGSANPSPASKRASSGSRSKKRSPEEYQAIGQDLVAQMKKGKNYTGAELEALCPEVSGQTFTQKVRKPLLDAGIISKDSSGGPKKTVWFLA